MSEEMTAKFLYIAGLAGLDPGSALAAQVRESAEEAEGVTDRGLRGIASIRQDRAFNDEGIRDRVQLTAARVGQRAHAELKAVEKLRTRREVAAREITSATLEPMSDASEGPLRGEYRATVRAMDDGDRELEALRAGRDAHTFALAALKEAERAGMPLVSETTLDEAIRTAGRQLKPDEAEVMDRLASAMFTLEANWRRVLRTIETAADLAPMSLDDPERVDELVERLRAKVRS